MNTAESSATAYDKLSAITDEYNEVQARVQELRVLTRALKALAATYCTPDTVEQPMGQAIVQMTDAAGVERNRLYIQAHRLGNEMDRLNALIQNGAFNEVR